MGQIIIFFKNMYKYLKLIKTKLFKLMKYQEMPLGVCRTHKSPLRASTRTPLRELKALPRPLAGGGRLAAPLTTKLTLNLGLSGSSLNPQLFFDNINTRCVTKMIPPS